MRYTTLLFDLDGTLTDPAEGITNAVAYSLRGLGFSVPPYVALLRFIGPPLLEAYRDFCGMSGEEALSALALFREYYTERGITENRLMPGAQEMLSRLSACGICLAVASSKPEEQVHRVLSDFKIAHFFSVAVGSTPDQSRVKKADMIACALRAIGNPEPSTCLMVGDRSYDVIGARACGVDTLGVLCGYGGREELLAVGAIALAEDLPCVADFVLSHV